MLIIPVIDLKDGQVVHAKQGLRESYSPIESILSNRADPNAVLSGFFKLYPFKVIYIADLDAIMEKGSNLKVILELAYQYPQCEFWLDAGIKTIREQSPQITLDNIRFVLGSENKLTNGEFNSLVNEYPELILSLDFVEGKLKENSYLLENSHLWPNQVITMMLSRVGSDKGIDDKCLNTVLNLANNKSIYAAGGVRNKEDLIQLKSMDISGVLVASALHNGAITKEELKAFT